MKLEIRNLTVILGQSRIIDNLSIDFSSGTIAGIIGLNGAGKTTFFNCISGINRNYTGSIEMNGQKVTVADIFYLESDYYFYPQLTGEEYLEIALGRRLTERMERFAAAFRINLKELVDSYSAGMKRKLLIIALISSPKQVLLLDEPFNGLDLETLPLLRLALHHLREQGKIILISSHILEVLVESANTLLLLKNGQILYIDDLMQRNLKLLFPDLTENERRFAALLIS